MVISPTVLKEKHDKKVKDIVKKLEKGIDERLIRDWDGVNTETIFLRINEEDEEPPQEAIDEIKTKYINAGWRVEYRKSQGSEKPYFSFIEDKE